jgi:hypothetical protein
MSTLFLTSPSYLSIITSPILHSIIAQREPDTSVPEILKGVSSLKFVEDIAIKKIVDEHPSLVEPGGFLYKGNEQREAMARMAGEKPGLAPLLLGGSGDDGSDGDSDGDSTAMTLPIKKVKVKDDGPLRLNKFKTTFKKSQESMGKLPLYVQLARLTADGGEVSSGTLHDEYWDQNNMSMINLAKSMAVPIIIQVPACTSPFPPIGFCPEFHPCRPGPRDPHTRITFCLPSLIMYV